MSILWPIRDIEKKLFFFSNSFQFVSGRYWNSFPKMNTFFSERLVALSKTHLVTRNRLFRKTEVRVNSFVTQFALFVLFNWPKVNTFFGVVVTKYLTNCNKVRLFFKQRVKKKEFNFHNYHTTSFCFDGKFTRRNRFHRPPIFPKVSPKGGIDLSVDPISVPA